MIASEPNSASVVTSHGDSSISRFEAGMRSISGPAFQNVACRAAMWAMKARCCSSGIGESPAGTIQRPTSSMTSTVTSPPQGRRGPRATATIGWLRHSGMRASSPRVHIARLAPPRSPTVRNVQSAVTSRYLTTYACPSTSTRSMRAPDFESLWARGSRRLADARSSSTESSSRVERSDTSAPRTSSMRWSVTVPPRCSVGPCRPRCVAACQARLQPPCSPSRTGARPLPPGCRRRTRSQRRGGAGQASRSGRARGCSRRSKGCCSASGSGPASPTARSR